MGVRSPRRSAARTKRSHSASESVGRRPAKAGGQLSLIFPPDTRFADLARLSPRAAKLATIEYLQAELDGTTAVSDWQAHCLIPQSGAAFDQDEAFVSFFGFCNMVGLTGADRLSHSDFVRAVCAAGFPIGISRVGRKFHRGGLINDKFGGIVPVQRAAEIGLFIEERCIIGGNSIADRGRSSLIFEDYRKWAIARGDEPLGIVKFAKVLKARGFYNMHSDGRWWRGLRLAEPAAPAGTQS